jgi:formylglycine-generating enzyme required for sulfatase activity
MPSAGSGKHTHLNGGQGLAYSGVPGTSYEQGWDAADWNSAVAPTSGALTTGCVHDGVSRAADATWTATAGTHENLPINCINWYEAYAFCIWDGGFLASDAEWGYVAAGGAQQREYPWGPTEPGTASQYAIYGCYYPSGVIDSCTGIANIAPVGTATLGAGLWGQLDLAGEMNQWTLDDSSGGAADPCIDCGALPVGATARVSRGGGYSSPATGLASFARLGENSLYRLDDSGFRCARVP